MEEIPNSGVACIQGNPELRSSLTHTYPGHDRYPAPYVRGTMTTLVSKTSPAVLHPGVYVEHLNNTLFHPCSLTGPGPSTQVDKTSLDYESLKQIACVLNPSATTRLAGGAQDRTSLEFR